MADHHDLRAFALDLPEATEEPHHDLGSWRVRGKIFATFPGPDELRVFVDEDGIREAVAELPDWCEELWWGKKLSGVRVDVPRADAAVVQELLVDAWRRKAPKALVRTYDEAG